MRSLLLRARSLLSSFFDPVQLVRACAAFPRFIADWRKYTQLPGAEKIRIRDLYPCLHDRLRATPVDSHYFYANGWAMRRILAQNPTTHVDIGSQSILASLLSAALPVTFVDYRPLHASLPGLECLSGDILKLPFRTGSIRSISCLHVAEHIGLGRYGDSLNPAGTFYACGELARVLAPAGNLYFAVPTGAERLCFNAHRIYQPQTICRFFSGLDLVEMSGVHDDGRYVEQVAKEVFALSRYACGFYWFRRPASP
jgi:hypothetical protein